MKKKIFMALIIVIAMFVLQGIIGTSTAKAEIITGSEGAVSWSFDSETGTLTFSGSGEITNKWKDTIDKSNIKSVKIQNGIDKIGYGAFAECNGIESVTVSNSVTSIGEYSFIFCKNMVSIEIPDSVTDIGNYAFEGCEKLSLNKLPNKLITIGDGAFMQCQDIKELDIPNSVTKIGNFAFQHCGLTKIYISSNVNNIGHNVFVGCLDLKDIEVSGDNIFYSSVNGVLFDKNQEKILSYPGGKKQKEYTIPNTVKYIASYTFSSCSELEKVVIPNSVINEFDFSIFAHYEQNPDNPFIYEEVLLNDNLTIYCKSNSQAKLCAEENNIKYVIDDTIPSVDVKQNGNKIEITASDDGAGLATKAYSINGKDWQQSNTFIITESGKYKIYVRDALDNIAEKEIEVTSFKENDGDTNKDDSKDNTEDKTDEDKNNKQEDQTPSKDGTQAQSKIPQTGTTSIVSIFILLGTISVISYKKFKKNNY